VAALGAAALGACALRVGSFALAVRGALAHARRGRAWSRPLPAAPVMLVVGDSLAVGLGAERPADTIAGRLAIDYPHVSLVNRARCGARTQEMLAQLALHPAEADLCAIWMSAGGNDVIANTGLPALREHVRATLGACRARTDTVVVTGTANVGLAPLFFWPVSRVLSDRTRRVRDLLREECERSGAQFVDFFHEADSDPFSREPERFFGPDGVHPSSECYRHCYLEILRRTGLHAALADARRAQPRAPAAPARAGMRVAEGMRTCADH
jgi:lysophospholipase L1-like esterase